MAGGRSKLAKLARALGWGLFGVLGVTVATVIVLTQTGMGRQFALERALGVLNQSVFEGELQVGRLAGPVFGRVALEDVSLTTAEGEALATLGRAEVEYELLPLLRGEVDVTHVRIADLQVEAHVQEDGTLDLAQVVRSREGPKPERDGTPPRVWLQDITLDGVGFVLRDRRNDDARVVRVEELVAGGSLRLERDGRLDVRLPEVQASAATPIDPSRLAPIALRGVRAQLDGRHVEIELRGVDVGETQLIGFESTLELSGGESALPFAHIDVRFPRFTLHPDEVNPVIGRDLLLAPIRIGASIAGPADAVVLSVPVEGSEGTIEVQATLDLRDPATPAYQGVVRLLRVRPGSWIDVGGFDADVSAGLYVNGRGITPDTLEVDVSLDVGPSRVGPVRVREAVLGASFAEQVIALDQLIVRSRDATLEASGRAGLRAGPSGNEVALALALRAPEVERTLAGDVDLALRGALDVEVDVAGSVPIDALQSGARPGSLDAWRALLEGLTGSVRVGADDLSFPGGSVRRASVDAELSGSVGNAEGASITLDARGIALGATSITRASLDATGGLSAARLRAGATVEGDRFDVDAEVAWTAGDPAQGERTQVEVGLREARATLSGLELALEEEARVRAELDGLRWQRLRVDDFTLAALGSRLRVGADLRATGAVRANVAVESLPVVRAAGAFGVALPLESANLALAASLEGSLAAPRLDARVALTGVRAEGVPEADVRAELSYAAGSADAEVSVSPQGADRPWIQLSELSVPLRMRLDEGDVGVVSGGALEGRVALADVPLASILAFVDGLPVDVLAGVASGGATLSGSPDAPAVEVDVSVDGVDLVARAGDRALAFSDVAFALRGPTRLEAGTLHTESEATLHVGERRWLRAAASGSVRIDALGEGVEAILAEPIHASVNLGPLRVRDVPSGLLDESAEARGTLALSGGVMGGVAPFAKGSLRVDGARAFGLGPMSLRANLDARESAALDASVEWGERKLVAARAAIDAPLRDLLAGRVAAQSTLEAEAALTQLPVRLLAPVSEPLAEDPSVLSGLVSISGTAAAPVGSAGLRLDEVPLLDGAAGRIELAATLAEGRASVDGTIRSDGEVRGSVQAVSQLDFSEDGGGPESWPLDASLDAEDAPLAALLPSLVFGSLLEEVGGSVDASLDVTGFVAAPILRGEVHIEDGSAGVIPLRRNFDEVTLTIDVSPEELRISDLRVGDESGNLTGEGSVQLAGFGRDSYAPSFSSYAFALRFRDFVAPLSGTQAASLRGRLTIEGDQDDVRHETRVLLRNMRVEITDNAGVNAGPTSLPDNIYFVDEDIERSQLGARDPIRIGEEESVEVRTQLPWFIYVRTEGSNEVQHPLVDVRYDVALDVGLVDEEITLDGAVDLPSGALSVAGNRFEIRRGAVRFSAGGDPFDPAVDIQAVHDLTPQVTEHLSEVVGPPSGENATINVNVTGRVSELAEDPDEAIRLSSDPGLSEQDIFSVLATGRVSGEGNSSEAQEGVAALTSLLLGVLGDQLSRGLFVDTLRIEGSSESQRIEGGKYLSNDLYVSGTYIRSPDELDDNNFEVALQWILRRIGPGSVRMELRGGDRAKGGLELLYLVSRRARRALADAAE